MIKITPQSIQLELIQPVYKVRYVDPGNGSPLIEQEKLIKELRVKKWFDVSSISSIEEYVTTKHKIAKKRCVVFDRFSGRFYNVACSPEELADLLFTHNTNPIGYKNVTTVSRKKPQIRKYRR